METHGDLLQPQMKHVLMDSMISEVFSNLNDSMPSLQPMTQKRKDTCGSTFHPQTPTVVPV